MNAVEIEQAISELARQLFEPLEFPFAFLVAFGNSDPKKKRNSQFETGFPHFLT